MLYLLVLFSTALRAHGAEGIPGLTHTYSRSGFEPAPAPAPKGDAQQDPLALLGWSLQWRGVTKGPTNPLHPPAALSIQLHLSAPGKFQESFTNCIYLHAVIVILMERKKHPLFWDF